MTSASSPPSRSRLTGAMPEEEPVLEDACHDEPGVRHAHLAAVPPLDLAVPMQSRGASTTGPTRERAAPPRPGAAQVPALSMLAVPAVSPRPSSAPAPARTPRSARATATVTYTATVTVEATDDCGSDGEERVTYTATDVEAGPAAQPVCSSVVLSPSAAQAQAEAARAADAGPRGAPAAGGKGGHGGAPAVMSAARGRTKMLLESPVWCKGTLLASRGTTGGERGRAGLLEGQLGAGFRPRWFAIVAFDRGGLMEARRRLEPVLLWTASEEKFEQLLGQLEESEEVPHSYLLRTGSGTSALRLPQVLGSLTLRSAKRVAESRRLDLPDTLFAAIEINTSKGRECLLGVEGPEDLSRWLHALRAARRPQRMRTMGTRMMSRLQSGASAMTKFEDDEPETNKWVQEVGAPRLFHALWYVLLLGTFVWIFSLVWLFNPYLAPCRHTVATFADDTTGQCFEVASGDLVEGCLSWGKQANIMGSWRSWVPDLASTGLFDSRLTLEGDVQTCFEEVDGWKLFWFWGFVAVEIISKASALGFSQLNWRVILRGARTLDEMEPAFPERDWPEVDVLLCHFAEPAEETMETLAKMLEIDYPPSKLHIYICDDGYFKSDFKEADEKPDIHWPTARANRSLIQLSGDVRQLTEDLMGERAASTEQDGVCRLASESVYAASTDGTGQRQVHQYKVTKEKLPEPSNAERRVPRADCAVGYVQDTYAIPGMPRVSYVARVKPRKHHSKAGNINNVLYNVGSSGQYTAVFDNDMQPHPKFLTSTLPLFFDARPDEEEDDDECPYTDDLEANTVAYVQTPQYFKANWLMTDRGDPLSHANTAFFDCGLQGMDGYDSTMFVGTNCIWRREALDSVSGIQYGTVSEDFWTGYVAQAKGWNSAYMRKDRQGPKEQRFRLSEGNVPENVAASMVQRKRWHKGSVELFLGAGTTGAQDPEWTPPPARVPQRLVPGRARRYRKTQYALLCLAWLNVFPPLFYTLLVIGGLWSNRLWFYLNPLGSYAIMIPFLLLASVVPTLGDISVPAEQLMSSLSEYFTYAPVRLVGTLEAFYSKVTGRAATWGNTGGTKAGSWNEFPIMLFVVAISVGLVRSVVLFFAFDTTSRLSDVLPIWAFACYMLLTYGKTARVSIQEFLEWGYDSLSGSLVAHWLVVPGIMAATVLMQWKEETDWSCF